MDSGETVAILKADKKTLLASGRIVHMNLDESKVEIHIENSFAIFHLNRTYHFELLDNEDGTYDALYLEPVPGTNGQVNRLEWPRFYIGGSLKEEVSSCSPSGDQAVLF